MEEWTVFQEISIGVIGAAIGIWVHAIASIVQRHAQVREVGAIKAALTDLAETLDDIGEALDDMEENRHPAE